MNAKFVSKHFINYLNASHKLITCCSLGFWQILNFWSGYCRNDIQEDNLPALLICPYFPCWRKTFANHTDLLCSMMSVCGQLRDIQLYFSAPKWLSDRVFLVQSQTVWVFIKKNGAVMTMSHDGVIRKNQLRGPCWAKSWWREQVKVELLLLIDVINYFYSVWL